MTGVVDFFKNTATKDGDGKSVDMAVSSPAFSITKVLTAASVIVAPLATLVTKVFAKDFHPGPTHVVALTIGLLAFIGVLASADVLARSIAASAQARGDAMAKSRDSENIIAFDKPLRATLVDAKTDPIVHVLAATGGAQAHFLIKKQDGSLTWALAEKVRILEAA